MASCGTFDPLGPYITDAFAHVDCTVRSLGAEGYQALAGDISTQSVLTGLIAIFIALIGYRTLFGSMLSMREGAVGALKIGAAITLATQWSSYQTLIYDVVTDGPVELATSILRPIALGNEDASGLIARSQSVYEAMSTITTPNSDRRASPPPQTSAVNGQAAPDASQQTAAGSPTLAGLLPAEQRASLQSAEIIFSASTLSGLLAPRIVAAIMLALAPVIAGFLLFEVTQGLVIGWLRILLATIFANIAASAVLALQLTIFAPQVAMLQYAIDHGITVPTLVSEITVSSALFAALMAATIIGVATTAFGLRVPVRILSFASKAHRSLNTNELTREAPFIVQSARTLMSERTRVQRIADAIVAVDRREALTSRTQITSRLAQSSREDQTNTAHRISPIGQARRRKMPRASSSIRLRDA